MTTFTKTTLLIAEGDAELCELYDMTLSEHGFAVETASDGLECLAKLRRMAPTVLILDRELRWGGGDGVLDWLREERGTSAIPVVLTTASHHGPDGTDAMKPPVVNLLPKPFALTALLETVRTAVARKGQKAPSVLDRAVDGPEYFTG